jgi:hypothetical protein
MGTSAPRRATATWNRRGRTGPDPRQLLDAVNSDEMRRAAAAIARSWLEQAHQDPAWLVWLRPRKHQAFVVLTLCRLLYTLDAAICLRHLPLDEECADRLP